MRAVGPWSLLQSILTMRAARFILLLFFLFQTAFGAALHWTCCLDHHDASLASVASDSGHCGTASCAFHHRDHLPSASDANHDEGLSRDGHHHHQPFHDHEHCQVCRVLAQACLLSEQPDLLVEYPLTSGLLLASSLLDGASLPSALSIRGPPAFSGLAS
jgi:hypothetical protein